MSYSRTASTWAIAIWLITGGPAGTEPVAAHGMADAWQSARRSVVSVLPVWPGRPANLDEPEGSGLVTGDGRLVLTANHVLGPGSAPTRILVRDHDGNVQPAKVIARNPQTDIALLRVETELQPVQWAGELQVGQDVCAAGNAFGLGVSLACGKVSAVHRSGVGFNAIEDFIQTDAAVNPGMSGGVLFTTQGKAAGMLSAIFTKQSDANIGVNFAVHAGLLQAVLVSLRETGTFRLPNPGIVVAQVPRRGEPGREGVEVVKVLPGFSGGQAGLVPGDVIYWVNGRRVRSKAGWIAALASLMTDEPIVVRGRRKAAAFEVTLAR